MTGVIAMSERWSNQEMVALASSAIGKVDERGPLGIYQVTHEEIAAMAALLAIAGVRSTPPKPMQDRSPFSPVKGDLK